VPTAERARAAADAATAVCPDYSVHNDLEVWTAPASSGHDEPEALT
jgi:hypothetical protein